MLSRDTPPDVTRETWRRPASLGVGLPYLPGIDPALYRSGLIDFVEVTPDLLCTPRRGTPGFALDPRLVETAQGIVRDLPIVVHGVELSIGSADGWNEHYVAMLAAFEQLWPFRWHSEHLHFQTIGGTDIGVPLPLPLTEEAATLVADRARLLGESFGVAFLLENGAHYLGCLPSDTTIDGEASFLNRIAATGDCGLLLDLHNLHCNHLNNGDDAGALIDGLQLERVGEIHIAGGAWADGVRLDSHDRLTPQPVWEMLDLVLPRCPAAAGVVFEIMADHARTLGCAMLIEELGRLRAIWARHKARAGGILCPA
jgi:uncharacterized protein (UPF0276 family)